MAETMSSCAADTTTSDVKNACSWLARVGYRDRDRDIGEELPRCGRDETRLGRAGAGEGALPWSMKRSQSHTHAAGTLGDLEGRVAEVPTWTGWHTTTQKSRATGPWTGLVADRPPRAADQLWQPRDHYWSGSHLDRETGKWQCSSLFSSAALSLHSIARLISNPSLEQPNSDPFFPPIHHPLPPPRNHQPIPHLQHHPPPLLNPHHPHRIQILHHPVRLGRQHLLGRVAGDDGEDLAPGGLAGADPRGRVLEHEHLLVGAGQAEAVSSEEVAGWVGLAVGY